MAHDGYQLADVALAVISLVGTFMAFMVGLLLRAIFTTIDKNEIKSDEADQRTAHIIDELEKKLDKMDDKYRNNDRELYRSVSELVALVRELKVKSQCMEDKLNASNKRRQDRET